MEFKHVSVLLNENDQRLEHKPDGIVDCTLGGGGHSGDPQNLTTGRLIAIDQDTEALNLLKIS